MSMDLAKKSFSTTPEYLIAGVAIGITTDVKAAASALTKGAPVKLDDNGKAAKVNLNSYATKTNRKKLIKAYCDKSPLNGIIYLREDKQVVIETTGGRYLLLDTAQVSPKAMKDTQGVACVTVKKNQKISVLRDYNEGEFVKASRYKAKNLPSAGAVLSNEDVMKKNNMTFEGF